MPRARQDRLTLLRELLRQNHEIIRLLGELRSRFDQLADRIEILAREATETIIGHALGVTREPGRPARRDRILAVFRVVDAELSVRELARLLDVQPSGSLRGQLARLVREGHLAHSRGHYRRA